MIKGMIAEYDIEQEGWKWILTSEKTARPVQLELPFDENIQETKHSSR